MAYAPFKAHAPHANAFKPIYACMQIIHEEKIIVIGFVPADVVRLNKDIWLKKLDSDQISSVDKFLTTSTY